MADTGKTAFDQHDLIPLKHMLRDSNPGRLDEVRQHWSSIHEELQQNVQDLRRAVEHATQSWQGAAADGFVKRAGELQTKLTNTADYARTTSDAMGFAAEALSKAKTAMANISVPNTWDSGWKDVSDGFDHSDAQFKTDLASGMDRISAVNKNYDSLSAMEISHQYAIGVMEHLAPQYTQAASHLQPPDASRDDTHEYPPPPSNPTPPGGIAPTPMPQPRDPNSTGNDSSGHQPSYVTPSGPNHPGAPNSPGQVTTQPYQPPTGVNPGTQLPSPPSTGIDSWAPPTTTAPGGSGGFGGSGGVGPTTGLGGGSGSLGAGGGGFGAGGVGTIPIGGGLGGSWGSSGVGSGRFGSAAGGTGSGTGAGRGAGAGTGSGAGSSGQDGRGGLGGSHGSGGLGGGKSAAGGKSSGLVRRSGGTVGGARSGNASGRAFTEGGTGIGRNRPGQNGMSGMPGTHGSKKKDRKDGKRPDYLVEDEETWRTGDEVNPPVIE